MSSISCFLFSLYSKHKLSVYLPLCERYILLLLMIVFPLHDDRKLFLNNGWGVVGLRGGHHSLVLVFRLFKYQHLQSIYLRITENYTCYNVIT